MSLITLLEVFFTEYGYLAVFSVLVACGLGLPIPEDVTLVVGGIMAGLGHANVHTMVLVGLAGVLVGDGLMFTAGKVFGHRILRFKMIARVMTPKRYAQVQEKFEKYGNWVLFIARFLPGLRTPIFISAGISGKVSYLRFLMMDGFAALISVPLWVYLGDFGAENSEWLWHKVHQFQMIIFVLLGVGLAFLGWHWWKKRQKAKLTQSNEQV